MIYSSMCTAVYKTFSIPSTYISDVSRLFQNIIFSFLFIKDPQLYFSFECPRSVWIKLSAKQFFAGILPIVKIVPKLKPSTVTVTEDRKLSMLSTFSKYVELIQNPLYQNQNNLYLKSFQFHHLSKSPPISCLHDDYFFIFWSSKNIISQGTIIQLWWLAKAWNYLSFCLPCSDFT